MASMSIVTLTRPRRVSGMHGVRAIPAELDIRWQTAAPATRLRIQLATFSVVVLVAYHYSLRSLVQNVDLSTPLAYIGLVPAIALALAAARARPMKREPAIYDRQLDYIIGLPLIAAAVVVDVLLPYKYSVEFWVWRLDLVSMPLFVAGSVALIFGSRILWRQKLAVSYLLLAWPLPYSYLLLSVLNGFTNITVAALHQITKYIHVATVDPGSGGQLFTVVHHGVSFPLSVVSACSGVDGVVGFLLVGSAFAALVSGPRLLKITWLAGGMLLLWVQNLGRIIFIFWAGRVWGENVAINILHPFVGLVTFSICVVLMILVMGWFRLRMNFGAPPEPKVKALLARQAAAKPAIKSFYPVVGLLVVVGMILGVNNNSLKQFDLVADSSGEAKLASYSQNPATPAGWAVNYETAYTWAQPYFGDGSTWLRYEYTPTGSGGDLQANLPITADVVNTTSLESFSAYSVQACYNFHGYSIRDVAEVNLGGGIRGQALSYSTSTNGDWTIVYWIWPVKEAAGTNTGSTHYERVILYLQDTPQTTVKAPGVVTGIKSLDGSLNPDNRNDARLIAERSYMVQFAKQVIVAQTKVKAGSKYTTVSQTPTTPAPATVPVRTRVVLPPAYLALHTNAQRQAYRQAHPEQFVPQVVGR
jgi:exosortase/archaeosortase family protein